MINDMYEIVRAAAPLLGLIVLLVLTLSVLAYAISRFPRWR